MYRFKNSLIAMCGLATIAVVVPMCLPFVGLGVNTVSGGSAPTNQTQNVLVVNTGQQPVPVSGTVGLSGTPSVSLASGSSVSVSNTPSVSLASGSSVSVDGTVKIDPQNNTVKIGTDNTVKIDGTSPIPVRDGDNPARQPFQKETDLYVTDGNEGASDFFNVPANKRLVIEFVSSDSDVPNGQFPRIVLATSVGGLYDYHFIVATRLGAVGGSDEFFASQPTTIYADPGTNVIVGFTRNAFSGLANCRVTVSGHFVDVQ